MAVDPGEQKAYTWLCGSKASPKSEEGENDNIEEGSIASRKRLA
jgi:hypothetical protein